MWIYSRPAQGQKRVYLACSLQFENIMCPKQKLGLIQYKQTNLGGFAESTLNEQGICIASCSMTSMSSYGRRKHSHRGKNKVLICSVARYSLCSILRLVLQTSPSPRIVLSEK